MNLKKYFAKLCKLMLVCVLGASVALQCVAYGWRTEHRGKWRRDEGPIVTRDFCSGNVIDTLDDIEAISSCSFRLEKIHDTPEGVKDIARLLYNGKQVSVDEKPIVEIKDIPNRCSNLEEVGAVFLRGHRSLTLAPPPEETPRFNFKIMDLKKGAFLGIMSFTPVYKNNRYGKPCLRCILVKRWLVTGFRDHQTVGRILCDAIDVILQNGILCMIVMDYDADHSGIESELRVVKELYSSLYSVSEIQNWIIMGVDRFEIYPNQEIPTSVTLDIRTKDNDIVEFTYKHAETGQVISGSKMPHCYIDGYEFLNVDKYKSFGMRLPAL